MPRRLTAAALAAALWVGWAGLATAQCRLALILALDTSGSVDIEEYRQQLDGLAEALVDAEVRAALLALPELPVAMSVFEWSGRGDQRLIADWREILSAADIEALATILQNTGRLPASVSTGIGAALLYARAKLDQRPDCVRHVVDVSGDGRSNDGPRPQDVGAMMGDAVVNALAIGPDQGGGHSGPAGDGEDLVAYFRFNVIRGPDAFVEPASGYADYAEAMKRKLLRELKVLALSAVLP